MKQVSVWAGALLASWLLILLAATPAASAAAPAKNGIAVEHAWVRWLPENLPQAAYGVLANHGDSSVRLVGAASPDYASVTLHRSLLSEDSSRMEPVAEITIPAHGQATLAPGGYHLMLMQPTHAIKPGDTVKITLRFASGAAVQVDFPVRPATASGP